MSSEEDDINGIVKQVNTLFLNNSDENKDKIHTILAEETKKVDQVKDNSCNCVNETKANAVHVLIEKSQCRIIYQNN